MARINESVLSSIVRMSVRTFQGLLNGYNDKSEQNHFFPPVPIGLINALLNVRSVDMPLGPGFISLCFGLDVIPTGRDTAGGSE